jgi:hypothetical protein
MSPMQVTSSTRPTSPWTGQTIFETDTGRFLLWQGSAWVIPNSPAQNPTGLELVKTATCSAGGTASGGVITIGSAVSIVTVTNAFSATYDNYKILISGGTGSGTTALEMTLGSSTTGYNNVLIFSSKTGTTVSQAKTDNGSTMPWVGGWSSGGMVHGNVDVMAPFLTHFTKFNNGSYQNGDNFGTMNGEHRVATSYTSFSIFGTGVTLTGGQIRVYGYRNS